MNLLADQLLAKARTGDREALGALFREATPALRQTVRIAPHDRRLITADDIIAETFYRATAPPIQESCAG